MNHIRYECPGNCTANCYFCQGGLFACTVCGGFEGSLTTECCGQKLPEKFLDLMVYQDNWDFYKGSWHAPIHCEDCGMTLRYDPSQDSFFDCHSQKCRMSRRYLESLNQDEENLLDNG